MTFLNLDIWPLPTIKKDLVCIKKDLQTTYDVQPSYTSSVIMFTRFSNFYPWKVTSNYDLWSPAILLEFLYSPRGFYMPHMSCGITIASIYIVDRRFHSWKNVSKNNFQNLTCNLHHKQYAYCIQYVAYTYNFWDIIFIRFSHFDLCCPLTGLHQTNGNYFCSWKFNMISVNFASSLYHHVRNRMSFRLQFWQ